MINKKEVLRKLKKNRFLVLTVSIIVIAGVYYGVQKAIDSYDFNINDDIIESENYMKNEDELTTEEKDDKDDENVHGSDGGFGLVSEDEVDLELDEVSDGSVENNIEEEGEDDISKDSEEEEKIYVYITGEVNVPGVVILNKGSRIVDAINAAGGTTVRANISKVNLVYVLDDGMKVNIPNSNDLKNSPDFEYITMNSGDGTSDEGVNEDGLAGGYSGGDSTNNYSIVNINTATQTELESLPGIGPSLALKIINYRKENGKFSSVEEIKNVSGIGDSKFNILKDFITV